MKKILIFKTDRLGDLLNISAIISNLKLNNPSCDITLVCSPYNKAIAKYYSNDLSYIVYKSPLIFFLIKNFRFIFFKRYDLILQLDGKSHSYLLSVLIKASKKGCLQFIKSKVILGYNFTIRRPNFFISYFFNIVELSNENYLHVDNKKFHYLGLYLSLIDKLNIKIKSKNHYLPFDNALKELYSNEKYILFHLDERWEKFPLNVKVNLKEKILSLSIDKKIVISSNIGNNDIFNFIKNELSNSKNIYFFEKPSLHKLISLVYFSETCVSSHSGLIVHSGAAFKKNIIDIVSPELNNELDRWIPLNINYRRFDINNFKNNKF